MTERSMTDEEFDQYFDEGGDITDFIVEGSASRPNIATRRVNVDFPEWMLRDLDRAAEKLAINRQALIKTWLADRLKEENAA